MMAGAAPSQQMAAVPAMAPGAAIPPPVLRGMGQTCREHEIGSAPFGLFFALLLQYSSLNNCNKRYKADLISNDRNRFLMNFLHIVIMLLTTQRLCCKLRIVWDKTCREREIGSALVGLFFAGGDCCGFQSFEFRAWG